MAKIPQIILSKGVQKRQYAGMLRWHSEYFLEVKIILQSASLEPWTNLSVVHRFLDNLVRVSISSPSATEVDTKHDNQTKVLHSWR